MFLIGLGAIHLWASEALDVPKLTGERVEIAKQLATIAGLEAEAGVYLIAPHNWRNDIRPGVVYMQSPQPGTEVLPDSMVALWSFSQASAHTRLVELPDLRSRMVANAKRELQELELKTFGLSEERNAETVFEQYPLAGTSVYVGTSVFLTCKKSQPDSP